MNKARTAGFITCAVASLIGVVVPALYIYFGGLTAMSVVVILCFIFNALCSLMLFAEEKTYSAKSLTCIKITAWALAILLGGVLPLVFEMY